MKKLFIGMLLAALSVCASAKADRDEIINRMDDAGKVLSELMNAPDKGIPSKVLSDAKCVMVIPSMVKGGFVFGGRYGRGVVTCRTPKGWSEPAFMSLAGGSFGAQIGGAKVDLVLLFMNDRGVQSMLKDNFKLGGDASVAAGPLGRDAEASTDAKLNSEVLAYSRSKGAFAGLELNGAAVRPDEEANTAYYGHNINWKQLLAHPATGQEANNPFVAAVHKYFVEAKQSRK
jgi:SH3 domain-containing YSC84-like protein 1